MICKIEGCEKKLHNKTLGICEMHYYRFRRHGDVNKRLRNANGEGGYSQAGYFRQPGTRKREHIDMVEKVLGYKLPKGVIVHHVNENKADNRNENFVVCPDQGYHNIIHGRMKAVEATGDANAKPCKFCHEYEIDLSRLVKNGTSHYHKLCNAGYSKALRCKTKGD